MKDEYATTTKTNKKKLVEGMVSKKQWIKKQTKTDTQINPIGGADKAGWCEGIPANAAYKVFNFMEW